MHASLLFVCRYHSAEASLYGAGEGTAAASLAKDGLQVVDYLVQEKNSPLMTLSGNLIGNQCLSTISFINGQANSLQYHNTSL